MGKGKKNKGSKQVSQQQERQEMSERNVVQEEGFESDDDKNTEKSSMVKVDLHGSDSEEDNAAAGGGLVSKAADARERKNIQSSLPNLHKKKNKSNSPTTTRHLNSSASLPSSMDSSASASGRAAPPDVNTLNYDNLGHIVVRLLPSEYQAERLPDGRYVLKAAAIGYLAQKLGH